MVKQNIMNQVSQSLWHQMVIQWPLEHIAIMEMALSVGILGYTNGTAPIQHGYKWVLIWMVKQKMIYQVCQFLWHQMVIQWQLEHHTIMEMALTVAMSGSIPSVQYDGTITILAPAQQAASHERRYSSLLL